MGNYCDHPSAYDKSICSMCYEQEIKEAEKNGERRVWEKMREWCVDNPWPEQNCPNGETDNCTFSTCPAIIALRSNDEQGSGDKCETCRGTGWMKCNVSRPCTDCDKQGTATSKPKDKDDK
jgi:hypothetical protein